MEDPQEIDVERIMERVRENIRRRRNVGEGLMPSRSPAPPADGQVAADLAFLHSGYDVGHIHFTSHRRILGPFVVLVKKMLRKLLTPILTRQVAYNAANTRVATHLKEQIEALGQRQAQLREQVLATQAQELQAMREQIFRAERKLRRILYVLTDGQEEGGKVKVERKAVPLQDLEPDFDYLGFEERFRGSEEDIKERQRIYVEGFRGQEDVLDIGCGRGDFLELLREAGMKAKGVDIDLDMVLRCREKGLDVAMEDAFAYLEALPDESLGGIFSAQFIEHLEPSRIIHLVRLCHRKLRLGGILIIETVNPRCLMVFAESFYMDFSHTRPIHPEAMKFLFEAFGLEDVELNFSSPVDASMRIPPLPDTGLTDNAVERFNRGVQRLNELLYGFQDYAVIGRKCRSRKLKAV